MIQLIRLNLNAPETLVDSLIMLKIGESGEAHIYTVKDKGFGVDVLINSEKESQLISGIELNKEAVGSDEVYLELLQFGFEKEIGREQVEIQLGENGLLLIYSTDEGYVVDVFNNETSEVVESTYFFYSDLMPEEEIDEV